MMRAFHSAAFLAITLAVPAIIQAAETSPIDMIKKVADEVISELKNDSSYQNDKAKLQSMVNERISPHFDFARVTQLALGKHWRTANPEQKKQLTEQFSQLLVRTYSNALLNYRNQQIEYLPLKGMKAGQDVTIRTRVHGGGKSPVSIDFTLHPVGNDWKAYDVIVAGVSLVTNYRDEFNTAIQNNGIDGLIQLLKDKNSKPVTKAP